MRIAQVSPLYERVPPVQYGGTERIVSYLTEELVRAGHEVSLFASGDSITAARLIASCTQSLRTDSRVVDALPYHLVMLEQLYRRLDEFDLIHFHIDYLHFPITRRYNPAHLTTLHGRLDHGDLVPLYKEYDGMPVVSISDAQRAPLPWLNWRGTVYHGIPVDLYRMGQGRGGYLAFLGRVSPEKGLDRAIEIAGRVGMPLKIAAKVDKADRNYYVEIIAPLLQRSPWVEFIGEITDAEKEAFLGEAAALLFPIDWPEPFGLVMIEAMACGTPIVAFRRGSVPEVMKPGLSGYVVDSTEEAVLATKKALSLSRPLCRQTFERFYSSARMAQDYLALYHRVLETRIALLEYSEYARRFRGRHHPAEGSVLRPGDVVAG
jgi:glycosyltransferase involved in cell wall biosynthesis